MFIEIERDFRSGKYKSHRSITATEMISLHPSNLDLISWSRGARENSRFGLTTSSKKFVYIRSNTIDDDMIKRATE